MPKLAREVIEGVSLVNDGAHQSAVQENWARQLFFYFVYPLDEKHLVFNVWLANRIYAARASDATEKRIYSFLYS